MSWQAQTAVNHHSQQPNLGLFRLLLYLAEQADETGRIDPAPSQQTTAAFYDCDERTIRNRIGRLIDSGELKQVRVGSGPGNPSAYQICLPMPPVTTGDDKGGKMAETNAGFLSTIAELRAELKAEIFELKAEISAAKAEIFELKAEKAETKGGKGGNERRKAHSFKNADDPDRSTKTEERGRYTPPPPAGHPVFTMPAGLDTERFKGVWVEWYAHLLQLDRPLTQAAGDKQLKKLAEWGEQRALRAIEYSIEHGWKNIYEPQEQANGRASPAAQPPPLSNTERAAVEYARLKQQVQRKQ